MRPGPLLPALAMAALWAAGGALAAALGPGDRAPAIRSETWLNAQPVAPEAMAGKVRLVEFWTFG
ncbi:MAG TPA: hypothetical protein VJV23_03830 [Candidatus Polarisedimenticolia bacterium]|nr:hypothetical protein [Candidatus Polarisedimenticolia bacterium]